MRRVVLAVPLLVVGFGGIAMMAWAQDSGAWAAPAEPAAGKAVCTISDQRLNKVSGMVATSSGYVTVNGSDGVQKIFYLDSKCKVTSKNVTLTGSRDPQDVTLAPDGTIWIADIGDTPVSGGSRRETIALWKLPKGSTKPTRFRMSYPDGRPHDAAALLLAGDGSPVIVTKDPGKAGIYVPTAALNASKTIPMRSAGTFSPPKTTTGNDLGPPGRTTVTGGATAPDGSKVTLRTYADAFEFDVTNGNVVEAITKGTPRATALPWEPRGEAITYSADGTTFLTVSATEKPKVLQYERSASVAKAEEAGSGAGSSNNQSWFDKLTLSDITAMIGSVGLLGAVLVGVGVFGIVRARRRPSTADPDQGAIDGGESGDDSLYERAGQAALISPVPQAVGSSPWERPPAGSSGGAERRPGSASRGKGGEYRSSGTVYGAGGSGGGKVYGSAGSNGRAGGGAGRRGGGAGPRGGGTVYGGGGRDGTEPGSGSYRRDDHRHDPTRDPSYEAYGHSDREPLY